MLTQFRQLVHYRAALRYLVLRELKVMYSNSALGVVWSLFAPLLMMLVFTTVFTLFMPNPNLPHYPVYILAGLLPWNFFNLAVLSAASAVVANGQLINRVYFPREILPLSNVLSNAVNFVISLALLFVFVMLFQIPVGLSMVWLPVLIAVQLGLCIGLGLLLSAINVYFRDLQQILNVLMLAGFFLTPVVYPLENITQPAIRQAVLVLNPMAALITGYRQILYAGQPLDIGMLGVTALEAGLALLIGWVMFHKLSPAFAEEI